MAAAAGFATLTIVMVPAAVKPISATRSATTPRLVTWREEVAATRRRAYAVEPY